MAALTMTSPRPQWRLTARELILIFVFWTALATLSSVNRLLDPRGFGFRLISPAGPIAMEYVESWTWAALTPLVFWLSSRFSVERSRWMTRLPLLLAAGVVISIAVFVLLWYARDAIIGPSPRRPPGAGGPFAEIGRLRFLNEFLVYIAVLAAGFAREYFVRDQARTREAIALQSRAATLQAQLADARLDALRMQLNPHFLFNTLHAVSALVERDPAGVRRMLARLSELLRQTMDRDAPDEITLAGELAFLRGYLEIMSIRFQGRLRIELRIDDDTLEARVPNLVLQPIVENALEHGAARAAGEAVVEVAARRSGEQLILTVRDNGPGVSAQAGSGVGLANTRARLTVMYGGAASLELTSLPEGGTVATITMPFRAEARHA